MLQVLGSELLMKLWESRLSPAPVKYMVLLG